VNTAVNPRDPTRHRQSCTSSLGVGEWLERSVARELEDEKFVTAILAEIGTRHEAVFLNYGHPAPMIVRGDGAVDFPQPTAFALPLGLGAHGTEGPEPYQADFAPGEQLLLYTDGCHRGPRRGRPLLSHRRTRPSAGGPRRASRPGGGAGGPRPARRRAAA
jgi:serine phosphatase RsbU (regulator of sigma subunit)